MRRNILAGLLVAIYSATPLWAVVPRPASRPAQKPTASRPPTQRPAPIPAPAQRPMPAQRPSRPNPPTARPIPQVPVSRPQVNRPTTVHRPGNVNPPAVNRPTTVNRPNINRPNVNINRPNVNVNRPTVNRPNINVNRPTTIVNRPTTINNITNLTNNQTTVINRPTTINQTVINRPTIVNRPTTVVNRPVVTGPGTYAYGYPYSNRSQSYRGYTPRYPYAGYHGNWSSSSWTRWRRPPGYWGGYGSGITVGAIGTGFVPQPVVTYVNPYYSAPLVGAPVLYDYSSAMTLPSAAQFAQMDRDVITEGMQHFDHARTAFFRSLYVTAQQEIDRAISYVPNDPELHQLRSLIFFAQGKYPEAAAVIHSVLSVGPGWDWNTVRSLYPDAATYTGQLRALENFLAANRDFSGGRFLLGYHYLILNDRANAMQQFLVAARLEPTDTLARQFAEALAAEVPR